MATVALNELQDDVGAWAEQTFGSGPDRIVPTLRHLREELDELEEATTTADLTVPAGAHEAEEMADVFLILLHLAHKRGVSLADAALSKFAVAKARKWLPPGEDGVMRHDRSQRV